MRQTIQKWSQKTEPEKHFIAVVGASIFTLLITSVWVYATFTRLDQASLAREKTNNENFSPIAQFGNVFSKTAADIKTGAKEFVSSASVIFTSREYQAEITE